MVLFNLAGSSTLYMKLIKTNQQQEELTAK